MAQLFERLIIPVECNTPEKISHNTTFFICAKEAQQLLKQAQTYLATAQDISLILDRTNVVVNTGNYTQP